MTFGMDFEMWFDQNKPVFYVDGEFDWETFKACAELNLYALHLIGVSWKNGVIRYKFSCNDVIEFTISTNSNFCDLR